MTGPGISNSRTTEEDIHTHIGDAEAEMAWRYSQCGFLVCVGMLGILGNTGLAAAVLLVRRLRRTTNAFLLHQCLLDLLKSAYCLVYANSLLANREPRFCNLLGGSFIVCATCAAFNLLAMVMSESYAFADLASGRRDTGNCCCVMFGIGTVWFASFILNLGVALLPGNPSYMEQIGHCTFRYGEMRNYVLHALWVVVVTVALCLTGMYLRQIRRDITDSRQNRSSELRQTIRRIASESSAEADLVNRVVRYATTRLYGLLSLASIFVLFWYPLFTLTLLDAEYRSQPPAYKALTILACSSSAVNPLLLAWFCRARAPSVLEDCNRSQLTPARGMPKANYLYSTATAAPPPPPPQHPLAFQRCLGSFDE